MKNIANHRSLKNIISELYRKEINEEILHLEKLQIIIEKKRDNLTFLKRCRDSNIVQVFTVINHHLRNQWNNEAFLKCSAAPI